MKATERGGNGVRAASEAWEQAHRDLCVNVCLRDLGHRSSLCRNPSGHPGILADACRIVTLLAHGSKDRKCKMLDTC